LNDGTASVGNTTGRTIAFELTQAYPITSMARLRSGLFACVERPRWIHRAGSLELLYAVKLRLQPVPSLLVLDWLEVVDRREDQAEGAVFIFGENLADGVCTLQ
jgi:hypothetical protein